MRLSPEEHDRMLVASRKGSFYCKYGQHHAPRLKFERHAENKGICMDCAFKVYDTLRTVTYVPEISFAARIKAWREWHAIAHKKEEVEKFRAGSKDPGWVYYISQAELIKIGYTKDVTKRMKAYGPTATLLAVHPGTVELEHEMHAKFRDSLDSGREWFRRDDVLLEHIDSVVERFGDPAVFSYEYTKPKTQEEKVRGMFTKRAGEFGLVGAKRAGI